MAAKQHVLRLIDARREIGRPPLVGVQFLDEGSVRATDLLVAGSGPKPEDLMGFLFRHFAAACRPRTGATGGILLSLFTPAWRHAIKIGRQQITAVVIDFTQ